MQGHPPIDDDRQNDDDKAFRLDLFGPGDRRQLAYEDDLFVVVPTLGALHGAHMLVCAKNDRTGLYNMKEEEITRLSNIIAALERVFESKYGKNFIIFENGTAHGGASACSIKHYHLHIVPTLKPFDFEQISNFRSFASVRSLSDAQHKALEIGNYLFVKAPDKDGTIGPRSGVASQFMRRLVAKHLASQFWDWRTEPLRSRAFDSKLVSSLAMDLSGAIRANATH